MLAHRDSARAVCVFVRMKVLLSYIAVLLTLSVSVSAQFQFFEQMFGGGGGHAEPQNVRSDSEWYRQQYDGGKYFKDTSFYHGMDESDCHLQHIAPITCALVRSRVSTFHIIVPARSPMSKTRSS